jgi:hypothetical protein
LLQRNSPAKKTGNVDQDIGVGVLCLQVTSVKDPRRFCLEKFEKEKGGLFLKVALEMRRQLRYQLAKR